MSHFYVPPESIRNEKIYIGGREAHHIRDVMRLNVGDKVVAFDGTGKEYSGVVESASKRELIVQVREVAELPSEGLPEITLAQAIPKLDKMDFIVQKATELGIHAVTPLITERTIVSLDTKRAEARRQRWARIAVEAAKQCGRGRLPEINPVTELNKVLNSAGDYDIALLPCLHPETRELKEALRDFQGKKVLLFIGPEGDFTPDEIEAARNAGCVPISLGRLVLRCETAAIYALSVLRYELTK